jgi:hypothetical protein
VTRVRAVLTIAALAGLLAWAVLPAPTPVPQRVPRAGYGDAALYMKVIERIAGGEPYYSALGAELRHDDYPTRSPFNWRTPFHLTLVARTGRPAATLIVKLMALAAVLATAAVLAPLGRTPAAVGTIAQMGALATAFSPGAAGVAEVCAGVLIALSICAYYRAAWTAGALLAVLALFIRELAAPYCIACGLLSLKARRREAAVWVAAGVAYSAYYAMHVYQVSAHVLAQDLAHQQSWLQWNGVRFTLATISVNGWLSFVPRWGAAAYMAAGLAGTFAPGIVPQARWAVLTYFALFAVVGLPFNYYWGFITAPLWAFAIGHGPAGLRRLVEAARTPSRNGGFAESASRP